MTSFSNAINTRSRLPLPTQPISRPAVETMKRALKNTDPLTAVNPDPLTQATKPGVGDTESSASKAQTAAEGLVSTTFIEPILKQMRESNNTPPPFGPSNAEKQFASLLDTKLADEIVHAANFPLVDRIAAQLLRNMPVDTAQNTPDSPALDIKG